MCSPLLWDWQYGMTLAIRDDSGYRYGMSVAKITIFINERRPDRLEALVQSRLFTSRSQAVQEAVQEKVSRISKTRLAQECAKLEPAEEQAMAEEGLAAEADLWPPY